ncbi:hypothetical protein R9X47_01715 [Wukongibacter baidiensis]|uniref:hypothetical protein n=1 Tax=Wukongibacter baidiensis TaxID=1723361 RepID=UPI003D7FD8AA
MKNRKVKIAIVLAVIAILAFNYNKNLKLKHNIGWNSLNTIQLIEESTEDLAYVLEQEEINKEDFEIYNSEMDLIIWYAHINHDIRGISNILSDVINEYDIYEEIIEGEDLRKTAISDLKKINETMIYILDDIENYEKEHIINLLNSADQLDDYTGVIYYDYFNQRASSRKYQNKFDEIISKNLDSIRYK